MHVLRRRQKAGRGCRVAGLYRGRAYSYIVDKVVIYEQWGMMSNGDDDVVLFVFNAVRWTLYVFQTMLHTLEICHVTDTASHIIRRPNEPASKVRSHLSISPTLSRPCPPCFGF